MSAAQWTEALFPILLTCDLNLLAVWLGKRQLAGHWAASGWSVTGARARAQTHTHAHKRARERVRARFGLIFSRSDGPTSCHGREKWHERCSRWWEGGNRRRSNTFFFIFPTEIRTNVTLFLFNDWFLADNGSNLFLPPCSCLQMSRQSYCNMESFSRPLSRSKHEAHTFNYSSGKFDGGWEGIWSSFPAR